MVQRSVPVCGSDPIMASRIPRQAQVSPRSGVFPESTATIEMPNTPMREKLGRSDVKDDRPHQRQRETHHGRAEQAAHQRGHIGRAKRAARLTALGHRESVQRCCRGRRAARRAQHDGRDLVGCVVGRAQPEQKRHRGGGVQRIGERDQQGRSGNTADARQDAQEQAHANAEEQKPQARRIKDNEQGLAGGLQHIHLGVPSGRGECFKRTETARAWIPGAIS